MTLTGGNRSPNPALPTTYLTWTDLGLNLGLRGVCPKTNRLNNATAVKGLDLSDIYIYIYIYISEFSSYRAINASVMTTSRLMLCGEVIRVIHSYDTGCVRIM